MPFPFFLSGTITPTFHVSSYSILSHTILLPMSPSLNFSLHISIFRLPLLRCFLVFQPPIAFSTFHLSISPSTLLLLFFSYIILPSVPPNKILLPFLLFYSFFYSTLLFFSVSPFLLLPELSSQSSLLLAPLSFPSSLIFFFL